MGFTDCFSGDQAMRGTEGENKFAPDALAGPNPTDVFS
jgi:hypothetical protein